MRKVKFTRRLVLGGTLVSVIAIPLIGCIDVKSQLENIEDDGQFFSAEELTVLNDVAELMIPATETPGAAQAQVAAVIDGLMMTWAIEPTRLQFRRMLATFETEAALRFETSYALLSPEKRFLLIESMDTSAFSDVPDPFSEDYKRLKDLIFRVFYTSEEGSATHVPIPGAYHGNLTLHEYEALQAERSYG